MNNKILVVDDMEINREMLKEMLSPYYSVETAENGSEAIDIIKGHTHEFAVILLDLFMPVMDGYGVLKYMQSEKLTDKIHVTVISSEQTDDIKQKCFDLGAADFISKPFNIPLLRERIKNVLESNMAIC